MSKSTSKSNRRRTIETLEKREMFSTVPWGVQMEIEPAVEPITAVFASEPSEQVTVSLNGVIDAADYTVSV